MRTLKFIAILFVWWCFLMYLFICILAKTWKPWRLK